MNKKVPEITESVENLRVLLRKCEKKHETQRYWTSEKPKTSRRSSR